MFLVPVNGNVASSDDLKQGAKVDNVLVVMRIPIRAVRGAVDRAMAVSGHCWHSI